MKNSTVSPRAERMGRVGPSFPQPAADKAAHAASSYVRPYLSPAGEEALRRLEADTARIRRAQVDAARTELTMQGLAEYEAWAAEVAA